MSDFVNQMMPVANPDPDGLYPWMAIRAGGQNVMGNLRLTRPLNMGNRFLYNVIGSVSGAYNKYNNSRVSEYGASLTGHPIIQTPNAEGVVEETTVPPNPVCLVSGSFLTITNASGAPVDCDVYARITFTGYTPGVPVAPLVPVDGDTILIGVVVNGVLPVAGPSAQAVVVNGQYGSPTTVVIQLTGLAVPDATNIQIRYVNETNALRGILVKDVQLIATWVPP